MANNHIAEWFGHRVFPIVADSDRASEDRRAKRCPFLTDVTGSAHECVKKENAKGVCTVSTTSEAGRSDWLVCPFRALDPALLEDAVRRLFGHDADVGVDIVAATVLANPERRADFVARALNGEPAIVYFQNKLGGEISIRSTDRSPELSFDATMIEVIPTEDGLGLGRYGIFEIQTMDFHGSYSHAVTNLRDAMRLHKADFPQAVAEHPEWPGDRMEGPNIANVFKRTFYQMMFKFQIGAHEASAGCVFAIPKSVWDSWQKHLGAPDLIERGDDTWQLAVTSEVVEKPAAWIYVFDIDESESNSPNDLVLWKVIATDAAAMSHYALTVAPDAALEQGGAADNIAVRIRQRLLPYLPELTHTPTLGL